MSEPTPETTNALDEKDRMVMNAVFNPHTPMELQEEENNHVENLTIITPTLVSEDVKQLEILAVNAAEAADFLRSLELFNAAAELAPTYASVYNNRAQLLRIQGDTDSAMKDLDKALELSGGQGKVASQAYTQRGLVHRLHGNDEAALSDFRKAAKLGSTFAKHELCQMNPYAALCNQMLSEVFSRVMHGEAEAI